MQDTQQFRRWVRWLRCNFPSEWKVRVRRVSPERVRKQFPHKAYGGYVLYDDGTASTRPWFDVLIDRTLNSANTADSLRHEWAHVRREHLPKSPHDADDGEDVVFQAQYGQICYHWEKAKAEGLL